MVKILGISGSPQRGGNTEILLDMALEGAARGGADVEKIILNELCLKPCQGCFRCRSSGACVVDDDMRLIYRKLDKADGLIIASPIYFGSITAQLKIMIDRFNSYWVKKCLLKKPVSKKKGREGVLICCAGENRAASFANAKNVVRFFFSTLDIGYLGGVFCGNVSEPGEVMNKMPVLKESFGIGSKLAKELYDE